MTTFADPTPDTYIKQPGEWRRKGDNGPPIVTDPNCVTVRSGARAGELKLTTYSRPSNFGRQVENTWNLDKWNERMVALGMAIWQDDFADLFTFDIDSPEWKTVADGYVVEAKRLAGANIAAERGTVGHQITEDSDLGHSIITHIEAGENVGLPAPIQMMIRDAWQRLIDEHFEVLAVEFPCVYDRWRVAGTGDRIVRLKHDLMFDTPRGATYLKTGDVIVLDIKTGGLKTDGNGYPIYWSSYAVQICAYARSVPYDVDTEQRGEWPWEINKHGALIAHLDIGRALETDEMVAQLIYVDLAHGYHAGELVRMAKDWQKRRDVFSTVGQHVITVMGDAVDRETPGALAALNTSPTLAPPVAAVEADTTGAAPTPAPVDDLQEEPSTTSTTSTTKKPSPPTTTTSTSPATPSTATPDETPSSPSSPPSPMQTSTSSTDGSNLTAASSISRDMVVARAKALVDAGHGLALACAWPTYHTCKPFPGFKSDHPHTTAELVAILAAIRQVEDEQSMPWHQADAPAPDLTPFYKIAGWLPTVEGKPQL